MTRTAASRRYLVRNFANALNFTPGTTFGQITNNSGLNTLGSGADYWVGLEFKSRKNDTGAVVRLVGKNDSGGAKYPFALRIATSGGLEAVTFTGAAAAARTTNARVDNGAWHRTLCVWSQTTNTLFQYVDSPTADGSSTNSIFGTNQSNTGDIFIGRRNGETPTFGGSMQTFAIGVGAPSAAEISDFFYAGILPPTSTLSVNIPNTDGSGTTAADNSGNGNNAALTSPVWTTSTISKARSLRP